MNNNICQVCGEEVKSVYLNFQTSISGHKHCINTVGGSKMSKTKAKVKKRSEAFKKALKYVIGIEGGYSDDRYDSGGKTRYGIIEREARRHGYKGDMRELPIELAKDIYLSDYWNAMKCEQIATYSVAGAIEMFEFGVNAGISRSQKVMQKCLNCLNIYRFRGDLKIDGKIGSKTLARYKKIITRDSLNVETMLKMQNIEQGAHYMSIATRRKSQRGFIRGWVRRVDA